MRLNATQPVTRMLNVLCGSEGNFVKSSLGDVALWEM